MKHHKPSLAGILVRRYTWAAALTSIVMMVALLFLTDAINLSAHRRILAERLRAIEAVDPASSSSLGIYSKVSPYSISFLLLDERGRWDAGASKGATGGERPAQFWSEAATVLAHGEIEGRGQLPWTSSPAVWAARRMNLPNVGTPMILVAWRPESAIRFTNASPYGAVILAIIIAFGISGFIAVHSARYVRRVVDDIADSSSRMVDGDYQVALPVQPTEELDRLSGAITRLAANLDNTTSDLRAEHQRLERMEGLQRQFVADASHELRAPLTAMRVTLEAWQDGLVRPDEEPKALAQLLAETERLGTLVSHLLDLSRIEAGREIMNLVPVSIADIAVQVIALFNNQGVPIVTNDVPDAFPPVNADPDALFRILQNLVENARRFTPPEGAIRICADVEGLTARIAVNDTGSGIALDDLPRIWNRFARAADARATGQAGSGLGLAIVKGLTETMGGTVGAESLPGQGATVWVRLPLAVDPHIPVIAGQAAD